MFEPVLTVTDFYDRPRRGVAFCDGRPHFYESEWDELEDDWRDTFLLTPISDETVSLALEAWSIWRRWETGFHEGMVGIETHPALPEERERSDELEAVLKELLVTRHEDAVRRQGEFRTREDSEWSGRGFPPLEVEWRNPAE